MWEDKFGYGTRSGCQTDTSDRCGWFVLRAGDTFELLHTNPLLDDDMCTATPAIADDRLLIRTSARLDCIRAGTAQGTTKNGQTS